MKITLKNIDIFESRSKIPLLDPASVFRRIHTKKTPGFLLESKSINPLYGRMSLVGVDPILEIRGEEDCVEISIQNSRGKNFFQKFSSEAENFADTVITKTEEKIILHIAKNQDFLPENKKTKRRNTAQILRIFLDFFAAESETIFGIFGAFSYDFARLFEEIPDQFKNKNNVPDFHFFLFDSFVRFDLIREKAEIICFRDSQENAEQATEEIFSKINSSEKLNDQKNFSAQKISCDTSEKEFEELVKTAKRLAAEGELFEVVFSRKFHGSFSGDPFVLYEQYREKNPAPYLFFFDFGDSQIVGASPEMMVRVENARAHLRPISGTRPRGADPISDHENELELLKCEKERAELDMLIDLGRNDLKRVCEGGIEISQYRHVEKYSRVMHTIAHLTGKLKPEFSALDALIACQSAGTLTGAPKVAAMVEIEKYEKSRRGMYGGSLGYLTLSGEMDTGIIIRSAHFQNEKFEFRVGATLLHDSIPHQEFLETENKAQALLELLKHSNISL